ncbi:hypothetical protein RHGRI_009926 [Rhododendron griersonianum]|uniref:Uncharacterized protein n=1 Tax=Rhododendron griersonianum TaxID=479676 RepID=A0AAV6KHB0_9ERIC|nr:hypothetical protein RHGRI_009926 [Rhododendron griersonianum]
MLSKQGLKSLFPVEDIAVMRIWELLPHPNKFRVSSECYFEENSTGCASVPTSRCGYCGLQEILIPSPKAAGRNIVVGWSGDGARIFQAGEMLHVAEAFIDKSFHPIVICRAYSKALEDAIAVLDKIAMPIDVNDRKLQDISIAMHLDTASFWCHNDGVGEELYRHKIYQSIWGSDCSVMQMEGFEYLKESCSSVLIKLLQYIARINEHSAIGSSHGNKAFLDGNDLNSRHVKHLQ